MVGNSFVLCTVILGDGDDGLCTLSFISTIDRVQFVVDGRYSTSSAFLLLLERWHVEGLGPPRSRRSPRRWCAVEVFLNVRPRAGAYLL